MTTEQLKAQLSQLDTHTRADLAKFLLASLHEQADPHAADAWEAELDRRLDELESGKVVGIPGT
jgi:putative addiction module component (TIGR02574 family)